MVKPSSVAKKTKALHRCRFRKMESLCALTLMAAGLWGASASTVMAQNSPAPAAGAEAQAQAPSAEGPNGMTRAAVQRGILQCAARVEQVSKFTGFGPQAGGVLLAPANPADQRLFAMQMEVPAGASSNSLVDMDFAPNQANGCGAAYQAVSYWAQSCDQVANKQFAQLKRLQPIKRDVAVLDGGPATKVFLMRAGDNGCVSIKKEIVL